MKIQVVTSVLKANDAVAEVNRERLEEHGILVLNITSAPGSGKTALLESTLTALAPELKCAVVVGDLQTTRDAERLEGKAAAVIQINTEGGCHLQATQVAETLDGLPLGEIDLLFIENVGNMVCPAGYDLGEHLRVAMLSTPEGPDKVAKYPTLFQPADAIVLNKMDLAGPLEFDASVAEGDLQQINTAAPFFKLSARSGEGMEAWLDWLRARHAEMKKP